MEVSHSIATAFVSLGVLSDTQGILDFSKEFDIQLMDKVVMAFYAGAGQEVGLNRTFHSIRK